MTPNCGSGYISDSFACFGDSFSPIGLPCPASIGGHLPCLIVSRRPCRLETDPCEMANSRRGSKFLFSHRLYAVLLLTLGLSLTAGGLDQVSCLSLKHSKKEGSSLCSALLHLHSVQMPMWHLQPHATVQSLSSPLGAQGTHCCILKPFMR